MAGVGSKIVGMFDVGSNNSKKKFGRSAGVRSYRSYQPILAVQVEVPRYLALCVR